AALGAGGTANGLNAPAAARVSAGAPSAAPHGSVPVVHPAVTVTDPPAAPGLVPVALDNADTPEKASFNDFTPSPREDNDHVVFASGVAARGCDAVVCPALFKSVDAGTTWT